VPSGPAAACLDVRAWAGVRGWAAVRGWLGVRGWPGALGRGFGGWFVDRQHGEGSSFGVGEDDVAGGGDLVGDVRLDAQRDPTVGQRAQLPAKVEPGSAEQQLEVGEQVDVGRQHRPRVDSGRQHTHPRVPP
jgi:hypothetical protein